MEKKYKNSDIIKLVDKAFTNFENDMISGAEKLGKKISDDYQFSIMVTMIKIAIMSEIMTILKEEK